MKSFIQQWAESLGITGPVNGSWIQSIANYYSVYSADETWIESIAESLGVTEPLNGSWIQSIAHYYSVNTTVNGNWIQAILGAETDNWILDNGLWDDSKVWDDTAVWVD